MAGWSGGSVSFSGGPNTYSVTYNAPTYTYPPNSTNKVITVSSAPSSVSCGSYVSRDYTATYFRTDLGETVSVSTTIAGTAPACPAPPPPPATYPPAWSDNALVAFAASTVYSDGVSATNMNYSGSYSVSSGSLPTGISLNGSSGAVTGTPTTAAQSYSFTIAASNSYGTVTQSFSGTVGAAPTAGKVRVWDGSAWAIGSVKVWDGTVWGAGVVKVWDGSGWVTSV